MDYEPWQASTLLDPKAPVSPFGSTQRAIADSRSSVRLVKGHPGTGKTAALLLAAARCGPGRILYVTRSARLTDEAAAILAGYGWSKEVVQVSTVEGLLARMGEGAKERVREDDEVYLLAREIAQSFHREVGGWRSREDGLYAEIHAHALGRALPVAWRGMPACSQAVVPVETFVSRRAPVLGKKLAWMAGSIAHHLLALGRIETIFPVLARAARVARALIRDPSGATPWRDVQIVLVDEVQDLTPVESCTMLLLCRAIGQLREGRPPVLLMAGDEGQTVKPTDFDWGELADLVTAVLGTHSSHELLENHRTAGSLSELVARSWDLYGRLEREHRPRGRVVIEDSGTLESQVLRITCPDQESFKALVTMVERCPGAVFVYPGTRVPPELLTGVAPDTILTSREVKGLEFRCVMVLDAGRQVASYEESVARAQASGSPFLESRMRADQIRVAFSRALDVLVLVDRGEGRPEAAVLGRLCGDLAREVSLSELALVLTPAGQGIEEFLHVIAEEIEQLLESHPARCWHRAVFALERLARDLPTTPGPRSLFEPRLRALAGLALAMVAHRGEAGLAPDVLAQRGAEARQLLARAGRPADARAVELILGEPTSDLTMASEARALTSLVSSVLRDPLESLVARLEARTAAARSISSGGKKKGGTSPAISEEALAEWQSIMSEADKWINCKELRKADRVLVRAVNLGRSFGARNPRLGASLTRLGHVSFHQGAWARAEKLLTDALVILDAQHPHGSFTHTELLADLGGACFELGKLERARALLERCVELLERFSDELDERLVGVHLRLASIAECHGDDRRTLEHLKMAYRVADGSSFVEPGGQALLAAKYEALLRRLGFHAEADSVRGRSLDEPAPELVQARALVAKMSDDEVVRTWKHGSPHESRASILELVKRGGAATPALFEVLEEHAGTLSVDECDPMHVQSPLEEDVFEEDLEALRKSIKELGSSALPGLSRMLVSPRVSLRREALHVLGRCAVSLPSAQQDLVQGLSDSHAIVRRQAVEELTKLPRLTDTALQALAERLHDPSPFVAAAALEPLLDHRYQLDEALLFMNAFLRGPETEARLSVLIALEHAGPRAVELVPAVEHCFAALAPFERTMVLSVLDRAFSGTEPIGGLLRTALNDSVPEVRLRSADILRSRGIDPGPVDPGPEPSSTDGDPEHDEDGEELF